MQHLSRLIRIAAVLTLSTATIAFAQDAPPAGAPPAGAAHHQHGPAPAPTNLQVLPKGTTGEQVHQIMHQFTGALGVECEYCHAKGANGHPDFASDANPMKDRARVMLRMTMEIDNHYLTMLKDPPAANPVHCGTCHRGNAKPTVFVAPPEEHHAPPPAPPQ